MFSNKYSAFIRCHLMRILQKEETRLVNKSANQWKRSTFFRRGASIPTAYLRAGLALPFVPTVYCIWGKSKEESPEEQHKDKVLTEELLKTCDALYQNNDIEKLYQLLFDHRNERNADILWRLARVACERGKIAGKEPTRKNCIYEAFEYINQALELDDKNFAVHKWYAILLDYTGEYEGTKQRLSYAFKVKEHFMKAIELNPKDATSVYLLGYWCFLFADLPWYQRKIASVIFTSPPESTYDEALKYFLQAEQVEANFYSMNLLMLGKTYLRLGDKDSAVKYLLKIKDFTIKTPDDKQAFSEATEQLAKLGIKD